MDGPEFAKEIKPLPIRHGLVHGEVAEEAVVAIGFKGDSTLLNGSINMRAISKTSASFLRTLKRKLQYLSRMKIAALRPNFVLPKKKQTASKLNGASVCNSAPLCSGPEVIPLETMVEKYPCYPPGPRQ
ncbi:hypothetical protein CTAM01_12102 [Colletotrichum tamarilloi]|uniref:Uncharacterized protein n=1 Tax=Colletotrichum tamarilloi TaxID=1209934 RepID=A0ABQ9QVN9_9PEZI|nr:uncharacterized protein CTAM01_12102 [Colletotrichum tamarilloi]KAK1486669.1 hypothetical protein CTAM01_12102 [Colletotrichum tamarilloi]